MVSTSCMILPSGQIMFCIGIMQPMVLITMYCQVLQLFQSMFIMCLTFCHNASKRLPQCCHNVPDICPKYFGHIMNSSSYWRQVFQIWTKIGHKFGYILDTINQTLAPFGHILAIFGHILDTFFCLDRFWSPFGHILGTFWSLFKKIWPKSCHTHILK